MKAKTFLSAVVAAGSVAILGACSPDNQDGGSSASAASVWVTSGEGQNIIVGGVVFADIDKNGELGSFEPFAFTDDQGQTSNDAEACLGDAPPRNCLLVQETDEPVVVRIVGGYDRAADAPFLGQRSVLAGPKALLQPGSPDGAEAAAADTLNTLKTDLTDSQVIRLQDQLRSGDGLRLAGLLGALLGKVGVELDDSDNGDLIGSVTTQLVKEVALELSGDAQGSSGAKTTNDLVQQPAILQGLLQKVLGSAGTARKVLDGRAAEIAELARLVLRAADAIAVENPRLGHSRTVQILVAKAARVQATLANLQRDSDWVVNNPDAVQALINELDSGTFDVQGLVDVALAGDGADLADRVRIADGTPDLVNIGGNFLDIALQDEDDDIRVQFYFGNGDAQGALTTCLRFEDLAGDDGLETEGTVLRGNWTRVNPFTVVAELNVLGSRQSATIRRLGETRYRFGFNDEFQEFSGPAPGPAAETAPASNAQCRQRVMAF